MANVINILVWVFAVVGLLALTGTALYYIAKAIKKYKPPAKPTWPDETYMEKIGARCPTGWVYRGKNDYGENICQNYYNVPVPDNNYCYNGDKTQQISYFSQIKDWQKCQDDPGNCKPLKKRCKWIKKCGPPSQTRDPTKCDAQGQWQDEGTQRPFASWIGVADKC